MDEEETLLLGEGPSHMIFSNKNWPLKQEMLSINSGCYWPHVRAQVDVIPAQTEGLWLPASDGPKLPARIFLTPDTPVYKVKNSHKTEKKNCFCPHDSSKDKGRH